MWKTLAEENIILCGDETLFLELIVCENRTYLHLLKNVDFPYGGKNSMGGCTADLVEL